MTVPVISDVFEKHKPGSKRDSWYRDYMRVHEKEVEDRPYFCRHHLGRMQRQWGLIAASWFVDWMNGVRPRPLHYP